MTGLRVAKPSGRAVTIVAGTVLAFVVTLALLGPSLATVEPTKTVGPPFSLAAGGWLGTEVLGRDVWSRILHGGRPLVIAPALITFAASLVGLTVGIVSAQRSLLGNLFRMVDVFAIIPPLVVTLVLLHRFGTSMVVIAFAAILVTTPFVARYVGSVAIPVLGSGYVQHALHLGEPRLTIVWRHVLPNLVGPVITDTVLRLPGTLYLVAAASFLGFDTSAQADWAAMLQENLAGVQLNVWAVAVPAVIIAAISVPINLIGDHLASTWANR